MIIYFRTKKLQKLCSQKKEMQKKYDKDNQNILQQRLMELSGAGNLLEISHLPPPRCHELMNRKGVFSVNLKQPLRLLFVPSGDPIPRKADGGIDLSLVTEIEIISIEDTHDAKNQRRG